LLAWLLAENLALHVWLDSSRVSLQSAHPVHPAATCQVLTSCPLTSRILPLQYPTPCTLPEGKVLVVGGVKKSGYAGYAVSGSCLRSLCSPALAPAPPALAAMRAAAATPPLAQQDFDQSF